MAFIPAPNIIMVEGRCTRNGQSIENRWHFNNQGTVLEADLQDMAILVWNWMENTYFPLLSSEVQLNEVVATDLTTLTGGQYSYAPDATTFGAVGGYELPNEVSIAVSLRSASRGRSARGRSYVLSLTDSQMADTNHVLSSHASALAAAFNTLIASADTIGRPLTIVSYRSEGIVRPGGPVYFPVVNAVVVDTVVDSMRRRKPGVGT